MSTESLRDLARGIVFQNESAGLGFLCSALRVVGGSLPVGTLTIGGFSFAGVQRPEPHRSKARVLFESARVRAQYSLPTCRCFASKDNRSNSIWPKDAPTIRECLCQFPLIESYILL